MEIQFNTPTDQREEDTRPIDLFEPLVPFEERPLPWKLESWQ